MQPEMDKQSKCLLVIGAGQMRTGTHSLKNALERLYGGKCYHMVEILRYNIDHIDLWTKAINQGQLDRTLCQKIFPQYVATVDVPAAVFYKDLMDIYPDAKVILTTRNTQSWIKSVRSTTMKPENFEGIFMKLCNFLLNMKKFDGFRKSIIAYGFQKSYESLTKDDEVLRQAFEDYNAEVRRYVPKERLLEFEAKNGWEPLCKFLNLPVPNEPYPFVNTSEEFNERINKMVFYVFFKIGAPLAIAAAVGTVFVLKKYSYI